MALEITEPVEIAFQDADKADQRLDEFLVRDRLARILNDLGKFTPEQLRGNWALVAALEFQPRRMYGGDPAWDMHWQPQGSATDKAGKDHYFPDVAEVDVEIIDQWSTRARTTRHPLLRARYADLAWEVARYRGKGPRQKARRRRGADRHRQLPRCGRGGTFRRRYIRVELR